MTEDRIRATAGAVAATAASTKNTACGAVLAAFRRRRRCPPDLTITKTHARPFTQGQIGATYTLTVTQQRQRHRRAGR